MKKLNQLQSKYVRMAPVDNHRVALTVKQVFVILEKSFKMSKNGVVNRATNERKPLIDANQNDTGCYYLVPGLYEVVFDGHINVEDGENAVIIAAPELIRNGISITSAPYSERYSGNVKAVLNVNGGPFEFDGDSVIAYLTFVDVGQDSLVKIPDRSNILFSNPNLTGAAVINPVQSNIIVKTGNPFVDNVSNLEASDKFAWNPVDLEVVKKPKKTTSIKGKKWMFLDEAGVITHKLRVSEEEIESYKAKGYQLGFPPNMRNKEPVLLLENEGV